SSSTARRSRARSKGAFRPADRDQHALLQSFPSVRFARSPADEVTLLFEKPFLLTKSQEETSANQDADAVNAIGCVGPLGACFTGGVHPPFYFDATGTQVIVRRSHESANEPSAVVGPDVPGVSG